MPRIADHIYHRPAKLLHPYYVQIGNNRKKRFYYRKTFATLEEAIKSRDDYLKSNVIETQNDYRGTRD
jgi:hypothetical protein